MNTSLGDMRNVLVMVLAGGQGERLHPLTRNRAKPAVPFGGIYRIIDISLSNCLNSQCRRIFVLVQYKSQSLERHIRYAWGIMHPELGEFVEVVSPQKRVSEDWYLGTADSIYQNLYSVDRESPDQVLVLAGDHIYKMNYQHMVRFHRENQADITVGAIQTSPAEAHRFGILETDADGRVTGFEEKPRHPKHMPGSSDVALASMGIYVFTLKTLKDVCIEDAQREGTHDFGKDILPRALKNKRVFAYDFVDENRKEPLYWRDVGTIGAYWEANMDLVDVDPVFNLYDAQWPLRTRHNMAPPAKFVFGEKDRRFGVAIDSVVSPGCIVSGGVVNRCVLSPNVRIHSYSRCEECVLMHGVSIGRHARLRRVIVEKHVAIPPHTVIGYDPVKDAKRFHVTQEGIVVVEARDFN